MSAFFRPHPHQLDAWCARIAPFSAAVGALCIIAATILAWRAPPEAQQGEAARLLFVHVPAAWWALTAYAALAGAAALALVARAPVWDALARALAPPTATLATLTLITGAIWGHATWGVWWIWDARLTSMAALLVVLLGYMALQSARSAERRAAFMARIWALTGLADIVVIKMSVVWWRTLHQPPSVALAERPAMDAAFLAPLALMALGWGLSLAAIVALLTRSELARMRARARANAALGGPWTPQLAERSP